MESEASKAMNSDEKAHKAMLKAQRKAEFVRFFYFSIYLIFFL